MVHRPPDCHGIVNQLDLMSLQPGSSVEVKDFKGREVVLVREEGGRITLRNERGGTLETSVYRCREEVESEWDAWVAEREALDLLGSRIVVLNPNFITLIFV